MSWRNNSKTTVLKRRIRGWVGGRVEKLLDEIDGLVEIVVVHHAYGEVQFSQNFGTERAPVPPQDVAEVVVLAPVFCHFGVDVSALRSQSGSR